VAGAAGTARTVSASSFEGIRRRWPSSFYSSEGQRPLVAVALAPAGWERNGAVWAVAWSTPSSASTVKISRSVLFCSN
jgi:hypothetical protein